MADQVNHPAHYNMGGPKEADGTAKYETIKVIEDWSLGFCMGNALKYILRAPHKGTEKQDLDKARWYLARDSDHPDRDGPEFSMTAEEVASAWELPVHLALTVGHIRHHDSKRALVELNAHLIALHWSE